MASLEILNPLDRNRMESKEFFSIASQLIELSKAAAPIIFPALLVAAYLWAWREQAQAFFYYSVFFSS